MQTAHSKIIVGLDVRSASEARQYIEMLPDCSIFKIGPHFRYDPMASTELFQCDFRDEGRYGARPNPFVRPNPLWFDDSKLFDIEATVEAAVENLAYLVNGTTGERQFAFVTVHAHIPVMKAAVKAAEGTQLKILAVPLMTSFGMRDLTEFYNWQWPPVEFVVERSRRAVDCGCHGVICSAQEVGTLRSNVVPNDFLLVVPGTRPDKVALHDHKRSGSPAQAIRDGASYLVLSRPILHAPDPRLAFNEITAEITAAMPS